MIQSVEIRRFRGIREGVLADLTPLVVLVGCNGPGKGAVLDALLIGANPSPCEGVAQAALRRGGPAGGWEWLFRRATAAAETTAEIVVHPVDGPPTTCVLNYSPSQPNDVGCDVRRPDQPIHFDNVVSFSDAFDYSITSDLHPPPADAATVTILGRGEERWLRPLHELYALVVRKGLRAQTTAILGDLLGGAPAVEVMMDRGGPVLHLVYPDRVVPAALAGDGVRVLLRLGFELAVRSDGMVLLEEPEAHLHPGAIRLCARAIWAAVRRGVQVVLSTHSLELIDYLVYECDERKEDLDRLSLYRLLLQDGRLVHSRLDGHDVAYSRTTIEDDLR